MRDRVRRRSDGNGGGRDREKNTQNDNVSGYYYVWKRPADTKSHADETGGKTSATDRRERPCDARGGDGQAKSSSRRRVRSRSRSRSRRRRAYHTQFVDALAGQPHSARRAHTHTHIYVILYTYTHT